VAVSNLSTSEGRELEPENEEGLEGIIPGKVVEDNTEAKRLDKGEGAENDPVSQPLNIIIARGRLEGLERQEGGECPTEKVRNGSSERVESVEKEKKGDGADDHVRFGNLSPLFQILQHWVLVELFIELANVVAGLPLGLNIDGVVLDTFGCRHDKKRESVVWTMSEERVMVW